MSPLEKKIKNEKKIREHATKAHEPPINLFKLTPMSPLLIYLN
jgi:hypothetical protein